ncbi:MAG: hypothetical protein ACLP3B_07185 [Syntrophobacteraceae bacterium]
MNDTDPFLAEIDGKLAFQTKWRRIMSISYFTSTALALVCSSGATVVSAIGQAFWGSLLAATATVLFGLEKTLLLREKWSHHLTIAAELEALKLALSYGGLSEVAAAKRMGELLKDYAVKLPVAPLEAPKM